MTSRIVLVELSRPICGTWMPKADAPCARRPGHGHEHRSDYALDNLLRKRRQERRQQSRREERDQGTLRPERMYSAARP